MDNILTEEIRHKEILESILTKRNRRPENANTRKVLAIKLDKKEKKYAKDFRNFFNLFLKS